MIFAILTSCHNLRAADALQDIYIAPGNQALMEISKGSATYMLQVDWKPCLSNAAFRQNRFWFREVPVKDYPDIVYSDGHVHRRNGSMQVSRGDGPEGWSSTMIGIQTVTITNVLLQIDFEQTVGGQTNSFKDRFSIPLAEIVTQDTGKFDIRTRWHKIAQP